MSMQRGGWDAVITTMMFTADLAEKRALTSAVCLKTSAALGIAEDDASKHRDGTGPDPLVLEPRREAAPVVP